MNVFEVAAKVKLRFSTVKGELSAEDMWDVPLRSKSGFSLDSIAQELYKQMNEITDTPSFVDKNKDGVEQIKRDTICLKFDIVKHIIDVKLEEEEKAKNAKETRETNQKIMAILNMKEDEALANKTPEELRAMLK